MKENKIFINYYTMKYTIEYIFILLFLVSCSGPDIIEEVIENYNSGNKKVEMKFKIDENVLERYTYNKIGELVYYEVDSLIKRDFFRSYLLGDWEIKFMVVDEDTIYNASVINADSTNNTYKFTYDSLFVNGWKYKGAYRIKYIDSLRINLNGEWTFDDDSLYTFRTSKVNDKDTLTINSYSEFIWNNFLNTTDKEEKVVFVRSKTN